jgi:hypothetical protein
MKKRKETNKTSVAEENEPLKKINQDETYFFF